MQFFNEIIHLTLCQKPHHQNLNEVLQKSYIPLKGIAVVKYIETLKAKLSVPPLTYLDFIQFYQKFGQYHLTGIDIITTKSDFLSH